MGSEKFAMTSGRRAFSGQKRRLTALASLFIIALFATTACIDFINEGGALVPYALHHDLVYAENEPHERQRLDIYMPLDAQEGERFPVLLWLHGGSWVLGNKYGIPDGMINFAISNRIALVSMNYRYTTQAPAPAQIEDAKAAVRFLRAHADIYSLDADNIVASGFSAGGYLAAFLGLTEGNPEFEGAQLGHADYSSHVNAVAGFAIPVDFGVESTEWGAVYNLLGFDWAQSFWLLSGCDDLTQCPDEVARYSPINYVAPNAPPFYLQHGNLDFIIPVSQSIAMCERIAAVGGECVLETRANTVHDAIISEEFRAFTLEHLNHAPAQAPVADDQIEPPTPPADDFELKAELSADSIDEGETAVVAIKVSRGAGADARNETVALEIILTGAVQELTNSAETRAVLIPSGAETATVAFAAANDNIPNSSSGAIELTLNSLTDGFEFANGQTEILTLTIADGDALLTAALTADSIGAGETAALTVSLADGAAASETATVAVEIDGAALEGETSFTMIIGHGQNNATRVLTAAADITSSDGATTLILNSATDGFAFADGQPANLTLTLNADS